MQAPVRLCYNENVLGTSPLAAAAVAAAAGDSYLYPDQLETRLAQKLSHRLGGGLSPENFVFGNGCNDVIRMVTDATIGPGETAVIPANSFGAYVAYITRNKGIARAIPLQAYTHDLEAMAAAITDDVKLVVLCNPNNPTGTAVSHDAVAAFLAAIPRRTVVLLDEAYLEYADPETFPRSLAFVAAGYNVIITRTFSKLYGLAGLRIGYGYGRADLIAHIRRYTLHFHCSRLSYVAALAALDDEKHVTRTLALVRNGRAYLHQALTEMSVAHIIGYGNFIYLTDLPIDAATLCDEAAQRGVLLRPVNAAEAPHNLRVTIGSQADNERFIAVLREIGGMGSGG